MGRIVVGVDGSDESRRALHWATDVGRRLGSSLELVYAYDTAPPWRDYALAEEMTVDQITAVQQRVQQENERARAHAESLVASMVADEGTDGVEVDTLVLQDHHPAEALVDRSAEADMLVVGSRGRGGFKGLMLGSVSQQCLHHATCPVVVIPPPGR